MNFKKEYLHCAIISNLISVIVGALTLDGFSSITANQLGKFIAVMFIVSSLISLFWAIDFKSKTKMVFPNE